MNRQRQSQGSRMQGSRNPLYGGAAWKRLRLEALERDGHRCAVCGVDVSAPGAAVVDHIESVKARPDLALALGNLRTLCREHDNQAHREKGSGGERDARFTIKGCDENGYSLDPNHPWHGEGPSDAIAPAPEPAAKGKPAPKRDFNNFGGGKDDWGF